MFDFSNPNQNQDPNNSGMTSMMSPFGASSFDSSGMNYDSGETKNTFDTGQNNLPRDNSQPSSGTISQPTTQAQPNQTDGTLLGTVAPPKSNYVLQGFNTDKFNDRGYSSGKYTPAARTFFDFLSGGGDFGRNNLGGAVDYAKAHGFGNAFAVGDDKIDYGDGNGAIDSVMSNNTPWFQNGADRFAQPNQGSLLGTLAAPVDTRTYAQPMNNQQTNNPNNADQFSKLMQALFGIGQSNQGINSYFDPSQFGSVGTSGINY